MAKKKKEKVEQVEIVSMIPEAPMLPVFEEPKVPKINKEMYWEWRCAINEMTIAKKEFEINVGKHELLNKDQEILRLKMMLSKNELTTKQEKINDAKSEYESVKKRIEDHVGMSLNGCVIDDITLEVKKI